MFRRYVWLTLTLLMAGHGQASMSMTCSLPTSHAAMAVDTATVAGEDQPNTPLPVSFYRLRFELSTTAEAAIFTAQDMEHFLTTRFMSVQGDPDRQGVNMHNLWVGQDAGADSIAITADYAVTPETLGEPIPYLFEQTGEGSSVLRVFNVVGEETELLAEIHHTGVEPLESSLDLSPLAGAPPLEGEIQSLESEKTVWAFYYPWYEMSSWHSDWLQDWPESPYSSDDPVAIERHIDQAQRAGIDGFIFSWWGPGGGSDNNLATLLDIAQEKDFSVMINFETLIGSYPNLEPRDEETILRWLRYAISTYGDHPAFMRVDGKPVFVIWVSQTVSDATWENIFAQLRAEGLDAVFIAMFAGEWPKPSVLEVFDGLHTYNILFVIESNDEVSTILAQTYATTGRAVRYYPLLMDSPAPKIWAATVQPGYDDHLIPGHTTPVLAREDGALYGATFVAALGGDPHWVFITSWNEWWEHTYVEPSQNYGDQYLQITREYAEQWKQPASQCVGDANANGIGDVVDIQTTASEPGCLVYLPLVAANWRQPWPTAASTAESHAGMRVHRAGRMWRDPDSPADAVETGYGGGVGEVTWTRAGSPYVVNALHVERGAP